MYKIIRHYHNSGRKRTIHVRLTLEKARAHCADPETSSSTCTTPRAQRITSRNGPWFDAYEET